MLSSTIETPSRRSVSRRRNAAVIAPMAALTMSGAPAPAQFETPVHFSRGGRAPLLLAVGDFNRDGVPDVAVIGSAPGAIHILLGNGDGTFRQGATYPIAFGFYLATASLRHNGILDLVIGVAANNYVNVMLGNGDGTFQPRFPIPRRPHRKCSSLGDFTGHGNIDVLNLEGASAQGPVCNCLEVLPGNGDGTFGAPISTTPVPYNTTGGTIATGDFNDDGNLDVVIAGAFGSTYQIDIQLGNGDGTLTGHGYYIHLAAGPVATGYFTSDRTKVDLAVSNSAESASCSAQRRRHLPAARLLYGRVFDLGGRAGSRQRRQGRLGDLRLRPASGRERVQGNGDGTFQPAAFFIRKISPTFSTSPQPTLTTTASLILCSWAI